VIRAVYDANVLVSGFAATSGTLSVLIDRWRAGQVRLVLSQHILDEVARTWTKPYWQARFGPDLIERALHLLALEAEVTPLRMQVTGVATHPEDDLVLATAVNGQVDYLVTGDRQLQRLINYEGVHICSPQEFLLLLDLAGADNRE
jgi:putative PIN family toxin of toxin-antitoxin system